MGRWQAQGGQTTPVYLAGMVLTMAVLALLLQGVLAVYTRGVVRASLDDATRAGARLASAPTAACQQRLDRTVDQLLGGGYVLIDATCTATANRKIAAQAAVDILPWLPGAPTWTMHLAATSPLDPQL